MRKSSYNVDRICGDDPDPRDPSQEEWYVEISREVASNIDHTFCTMWKRDGRFVLDIGESDADFPKHDLEDLMDAFQRAKQTLDVLYPDS